MELKLIDTPTKIAGEIFCIFYFIFTLTHDANEP